MDLAGTKRLRTESGRSALFSRYFLISAAAGLLIGLFEAALLWTTPRVMVLLSPNVRYVVWFLAPLIDMVFFGLLGLGFGWAAARTCRQKMLAAFHASITATFVALIVHWFHREMGLDPFLLREDLLIPLACLALTFLAAWGILALVWNRLRKPFEHWAGVLAGPLTWGLLVAAVAAAVGVAAFAAGISFSSTAAQAASQLPATDPNIILITLDTVRADHFSSYGYPRPTTPHLDRFAQEGALFENAIASTSWTLASHASIFTGLLPHQHGADWAIPLPAGSHTLAGILRSRGYKTAGFTSNLRYCEKGWGLARGFESYEDSSACLRHNLAQTLVGGAIIQPLYQNWRRYDLFDRENAQELNGRILHWFRHRSKRPYFLFINYFDAHEPYLAPRPYNHRFGAISQALVRKMHIAVGGGHAPEKFSASERASLINAYDNCLAYLDGQVGRLLKVLQQSPEWKHTIVIITSDHGEEFGEHGYYSHGSHLYRETLHVPLIIVGPGVPQGVRVEHLAGIRELFSTVLDMAGGGNTPFSRYSLARFWNPGFKPQPFDDAVVSELDPLIEQAKGDVLISLTTSNWQYIYDASGRRQLFRWTADPAEQSNLADSPEEQATLKGLQAQLVGLVQNSVSPWRDPEYIRPLSESRSFSNDIHFSRPSEQAAPGNILRIGASQAYWGSEKSGTPPKPSSAQQDLMRSLPYQ